MDPYWKIRSTVFNYTIGIFGDKEKLVENAEKLLFSHVLHKRLSSEGALQLAMTDIEAIVKQQKQHSSKIIINYSDLEKFWQNSN